MFVVLHKLLVVNCTLDATDRVPDTTLLCHRHGLATPCYGLSDSLLRFR